MHDKIIVDTIELLIGEIDSLPESVYTPSSGIAIILKICIDIKDSLVKLFGENNKYLNELNDLPFRSEKASNYDNLQITRYWQFDKKILKTFLNSILEDLKLNGQIIEVDTNIINTNKLNTIKRVFIVHGHDGEMQQEVANVLLKLKLDPVILHEQPDEGKTIIEKFEKHSDVDFAIILLSPDDFAYPKGASPSEGRYRARQNVIMELGYFIAKLNRNRVVALHRQNDDFEIPSDYLGVLYKPYSGDWRYKLVDEMKEIDPTIDKNLLK